VPREPSGSIRTPGYSGKPLALKLGIKPGHRIHLAGVPSGFKIEGLPHVELLGPSAGSLDLILFFVRDAAQLRKDFPRQAERLTQAGMLWIAWPKKAAKVSTDLTDNEVRQIGLAAGLVDVKVCAVDETWSGLKFVRRLKNRA
jgi:hypothetical protein